MHMQEVIELDDKDQRKLWEEVSRVCRALKSSFAPGLKLNIAAIGNVVGNPLDQRSACMDWSICRLCSCICTSSCTASDAQPMPWRAAAQAQAIQPRRPRADAGRLGVISQFTRLWLLTQGCGRSVRRWRSCMCTSRCAAPQTLRGPAPATERCRPSHMPQTPWSTCWRT